MMFVLRAFAGSASKFVKRTAPFHMSLRVVHSTDPVHGPALFLKCCTKNFAESASCCFKVMKQALYMRQRELVHARSTNSARQRTACSACSRVWRISMAPCPSIYTMHVCSIPYTGSFIRIYLNCCRERCTYITFTCQ
jgi:hypothetical protein